MLLTNTHMGRPRVPAWTFSLAEEESEWLDAWIPWKMFLESTDTDFLNRCRTNVVDAIRSMASPLSIGELKDGQVVRVTDYWREPFARSDCRRGLSDLKSPMPRN
jgi:hypothetical protein